MPYKRKDSPIWWASFADQSGKRVRQTTGTTDRKEAEALEAKWKVEAFRARQWGDIPNHVFDEMMAAYLNGTERDRRARSNEAVIYHVKRLRKFFSGIEVETLTAANVSAYIQERRMDGVSNASINRELEVLSAAFTWSVRELGWRLSNPVAGKMLKEPEGRLRWLSRAEAVTLIHAAEQEARKAPHLAPLITLALYTGMRRGEMLWLEWSRVDLHGNLIYLEAHHTKAGKRRSVSMNTTARSAIISQARYRSEHCPGSRWVFCDEKGDRIASVQRSFNTACARAHIEDFRFHDLRHTCAAWLVQAGVPLMDIRDVLGHSTVKMTERYAHLAPENTRAAVAMLEIARHNSVTHEMKKG